MRPRPPYTQQSGLEGHPGTILTLALTTDGKTLVTGGSDGTRLWHSRNFRAIARPATVGVRGATTVVVCTRRADEPIDVIFSGTARGYFFCWRNRNGVWEETFARQISEPADITGIAFDATTNRLVLCSAACMVQAWGSVKGDTGRAHLLQIFSRKITNFAPRAVAFAAFDGSKDKDILVFGQNDIGPIYKLRGKTGETIESFLVGGQIGDATVDWNTGLFLIDNVFCGPSLWRYVDSSRVRTYSIPSTREVYRIRNVRFGEAATIVVCGSDDGHVNVFDLQTGKHIQQLDIGTSEWVQVVATAEIDGIPTVFAAPSREDGDMELCVWKRLEPKPKKASGSGRSSIWLLLLNVVIVCCGIGFVIQNAGFGASMVQTMVGPILGSNMASVQAATMHAGSSTGEGGEGGSAPAVELYSIL
ncbi:WD40-repeat-containing domain protein [Mycena amicta]|nr:WD40-repeat-containing domain protein [Mycena amicta]